MTDTSWLSFYLRNSRKSQAVTGNNHGGVYAQSVNIGILALAGVSSVSASGFDVRRESVEFSTQDTPGPPGFEFTDEWLADAELVAVRRVPSGSVIRTIDIARAQIVEASPPTPRDR